MSRSETFSSHFQAVVLAAGKSSRFNTGTTKLAYTICGQEMIMYPLKALQALNIPITLVIGYQKEAIKAIVQRHQLPLTFIEQLQQAGTGSAVVDTKNTWHADNILVMNGDMPLITTETITQLIAQHTANKATVTFVASYNADPALGGYGRVIKQHGSYKIVEAADFTGDVTKECWINAGIYIFKRSFLEQFCHQLTPNNNKKELYLTDLISIAHAGNGYHTEIMTVPFDEVRGVNTLKELWVSEHIKRSELIAHWMSRGVYFSAAQTTHIDLDVTLGASTRIESGVRILAGSHIGSNCHIDANSCIENSTLADHVRVKPNSIITDSTIDTHAEIGPFAHVRNASTIGAATVIGNFVEISKSTIGKNTKIKHLSYAGNAEVGNQVNIGAGTIVCNYNGVTKTKSTTIIQDHALIGSNNSIVAPVTIAHSAVTAAGSTITENVPAGALAIARARQVNKENYRDILAMTSKPPIATNQDSL